MKNEKLENAKCRDVPSSFCIFVLHFSFFISCTPNAGGGLAPATPCGTKSKVREKPISRTLNLC